MSVWMEFLNFGPLILEVLIALAPLVFIFVLFQVFFLRFPRRSLVSVGKGFLLTFVGLVLFLQGVKVGFLPVGAQLGEKLGSLDSKWVLLPIGFCFGLAATFAEPAVRIMSYEVEKASGGAIRARFILAGLSLGVAVFVALGMWRILNGLSLYYFVVPGYIIAMGMLKFSDSTFISIAFDSGGVATGPMTVTFIMALAVGVAEALHHRDPILDGFGLIALVAMAPILSIMTLGLLYSAKKRRQK